MMKYQSSKVYRIIVPKFLRKKILAKKLPKTIQKYYTNHPHLSSIEVQTALKYLSKNPMAVFPHDFQDKYYPEKIEVFVDKIKKLPYVLQEGKRLYFKRRWSKNKIKNLYNTLLKEQDLQSPHRYLSENFRFEQGDVLVDAGAAEGNFALSVVEKASRIILFEPDVEWIEPLTATFEPWLEKVVVVNKFVSDVSDSKFVALDDYFNDTDKISFLKIDIEGAEQKLFNGAKRILSSNHNFKVAVCTYHKQDDEEEFKKILSDSGFHTSHSDGYMLFYYDKKITEPYFRRGLVRAEK